MGSQGLSGTGAGSEAPPARPLDVVHLHAGEGRATAPFRRYRRARRVAAAALLAPRVRSGVVNDALPKGSKLAEHVANMATFPPPSLAEMAAGDDAIASGLARYTINMYGLLLQLKAIEREEATWQVIGHPLPPEQLVESIATLRAAIRRCRSTVAAHPDGTSILAKYDREIAEAFGGAAAFRALDE